MYQVSFSKITKRLVSVSMVFCVLFLVGCGSKEEKEKDSGSKLPPVPTVSASDGKITEENYTQMSNKPVTKDNLDEFLHVFLDAMYGYDPSDFGSARSEVKKRELRETISGSCTYEGRFGGRWINDWTDTETETYYSATSKGRFFDFSENGTLFLGGAVGISLYEDDKVFESFEAKANGKIEFRGAFSGSFNYRNAYYKEKYNPKTDDYDVTTSGEIVVISGGKEVKVKVDMDLLDDLLDF